MTSINGLTWKPTASLSGIVLMIRQSPSSWDTLNQSHSRLGSTNTSNFRRPPVSKSGKTPFKPQVNLHAISANDFLLANIHDVAPSREDPDPDVLVSEDDDRLSSEDTYDMRIINASKSSGTDHLPPGDIRRIMSESSTRHANS
jgi:hypothetical protein